MLIQSSFRKELFILVTFYQTNVFRRSLVTVRGEYMLNLVIHALGESLLPMSMARLLLRLSKLILLLIEHVDLQRYNSRRTLSLNSRYICLNLDSIIAIDKVDIIRMRNKIRFGLVRYLILFEIVKYCLLIIGLSSLERVIIKMILVISILMMLIVLLNWFIIGKQPIV